MNPKYLLLMQAYQQRDQYVLIVFIITLLIALTWTQVKSMRRVNDLFAGYILIAWMAFTIAGLFK